MDKPTEMRQQRMPTRDIYCELLAALMKGDRTLNELEDMTGASRSSLNAWTLAMRASGLITEDEVPTGARPARRIQLLTAPFVQREQPIADPCNRVYLAGPMTGLPELNYPAFNAAAADLRFRGWWVENPAAPDLPPCDSWRDYMRRGIGQMLSCDWVALLPGWERSRGARIEERLARDLGLRVVTVEQMKAVPMASAGNRGTTEHGTGTVLHSIQG